MNKDSDQSKNGDLLARVTKNFEAWEQQTRPAREEAELYRDYFDGKQWSSDETAELKARKQPVITDNMLKDKIESLTGMVIQQRTDPKAYPRTPQDEESSEAATDALRYVAENNDLDTLEADVAENTFIEGDGGVEVVVVPKGDDVEIRYILNRWDRRYYDTHSLAKDYSDATYLGTFVWMDVSSAKQRWPEVNWDAVGGDMNEFGSESTDDKPSTVHYDTDRKRVRVIEQWYEEGGVWFTCKFVKGQWIEEPSESPYEVDGDSSHPYCWTSAYVDRDGNRYGVAKRYKDLQDEVNHRRSKALHIMNTNQVFMEEGAADKRAIRKEINRPDGVVEYNVGFKFDYDKNIDLASGQFQLLQDARSALSKTSPDAQDTASSASGRSKIVGAQMDFIEVGRQFDQLRKWKREVYRKTWSCVQKYWTDAKWVRIRDEEGNSKFVQLNEPAMENGLPVINPMTGQQEIKNNVADLDVDIILDESPDIINMQEEQFGMMVQLAQAGVPFPPDALIMASSLRNKDQILEKLTGGNDPEAQAQVQQQQQIQMQGVMLEMAEVKAKIENLQADTMKKSAEAEQTQLENMAGAGAIQRLSGA